MWGFAGQMNDAVYGFNADGTGGFYMQSYVEIANCSTVSWYDANVVVEGDLVQLTAWQGVQTDCDGNETAWTPTEVLRWSVSQDGMVLTLTDGNGYTTNYDRM